MPGMKAIIWQIIVAFRANTPAEEIIDMVLVRQKCICLSLAEENCISGYLICFHCYQIVVVAV